MANLTETPSWDTTVYQFATTDPIQGGPGGVDNQPHQSLADRTQWLRSRIAAAITQAGLADGTTDNQQLAEAVVLQCVTAAALRSIPVPVVPNTQTVLMMTRGQATDGDGYGNVFKWVYNSTAADNGATVIKPTNVAQGRWIVSGLNASGFGGQLPSYYATNSGVSSVYETKTDAATKLSTAETFATSAANTAQSNAETFATSAANTAQSNAENFANSAVSTEASARASAITAANSYALTAANTAQSNAETFATSAANTAQSNAETFATSAANTAQSNAEAYANCFSSQAPTSLWLKVPSGVFIQSGLDTFSSLGSGKSFPESFPSACVAVVVASYGVFNNCFVRSFSSTAFVAVNGGNGQCTWFAIGY